MFKLNDAPQQALGFLLSQTAHIETSMWETKYPDIVYQDLMPLDYSADPWAKSITYFSMDKFGKAAWLNSQANDFPVADVVREKFETEVHLAGISYRYTLEEVEQARRTHAMFGRNLTADKASAARRVYEEMCEDVAIVGATAKGFYGLINQPAVTASSVPNGASASPLWANKVPQEILNDVNTGISGIWLTTKKVAMADSLLLPDAQLADIATRRLDNTSETTILSWIKKNNIYTQQTGKELFIRSLTQLAGAGAGGTNRMVAYRRSPEVLKMHVPMRLNFFPAQQIMLNYVVPGIFRLGGVDCRLPKEMRYYDGI